MQPCTQRLSLQGWIRVLLSLGYGLCAHHTMPASAAPRSPEAPARGAQLKPIDATAKQPTQQSNATQSNATQSNARQLSSYEQESLNIALTQKQGSIDPAPEGKTVESIELVRLNVIEDRDPAPNWLNALHVTTQEQVISREVLVRPGARYEQRLVDETERNLREFAQLSVVLIVPLRGSTEDQVRLLVVTKDVWSLRLSWEPSLFNGKLTGLALQPSETNVAGTTHRISGRLTFTPSNYWVGAAYFAPRIGGSRINAYATASIGINCKTHKAEGSQGIFQYGQPLYSSRTKWSWQTAVAWQDLIQQPFASAGRPICSGERPGNYTQQLPEREFWATRNERWWAAQYVTIPYRFRQQTWRGQAVLTRSLFEINKVDLSFGAEAEVQAFANRPVQDGEAHTYWQYRHTYTPGASRAGPAPTAPVTNLVDSFEATAPDAERIERTQDVLLVNGLPQSDRRINPYAQLHAYRSDYRPIINYQTLGLQEAYQVGHNVYLRWYPALRPVSSRDMLGVYSGVSYTWPVASGFVSVMGSSQVEFALDGNDDALAVLEEGARDANPNVRFLHAAPSGISQSDTQLAGALHLVTPDVGAGRFVSNIAVAALPLDGYLNRYTFGLGGTDQLRGYQPFAFRGRSRLAANTEFRTRPLQILSVLAGLSVFWDTGDAADDLTQLQLKHGGGVGLRVLFPQLDRQAFRIDFGFPLQPHERGEFTWFAGFARVFETPAPRPPSLLTQ